MNWELDGMLIDGELDGMLSTMGPFETDAEDEEGPPVVVGEWEG